VYGPYWDHYFWQTYEPPSHGLPSGLQCNAEDDTGPDWMNAAIGVLVAVVVVGGPGCVTAACGAGSVGSEPVGSRRARPAPDRSPARRCGVSCDSWGGMPSLVTAGSGRNTPRLRPLAHLV
jgi:hypothetical protein